MACGVRQRSGAMGVFKGLSLRYTDFNNLWLSHLNSHVTHLGVNQMLLFIVTSLFVVLPKKKKEKKTAALLNIYRIFFLLFIFVSQTQ